MPTSHNPINGVCSPNPLAKEVLFLVMGEIGSGKSHFINWVANDTLAPVNHNLTSTNDFQVFNVPLGEKTCLLVESPGFNHPTKTDVHILKEAIEWLEKSYRPNLRVGGVIYLHDITEDRGALKYRTFKFWPMGHLQQPEPASHLVIATFKWGKQKDPPVDYDSREKELEHGVWKTILARGATLQRVQDATTARNVISNLVVGESSRSPLKLEQLLSDLDRIKTIGDHQRKPVKIREVVGAFFGRLFGSRSKAASRTTNSA